MNKYMNYINSDLNLYKVSWLPWAAEPVARLLLPLPLVLLSSSTVVMPDCISGNRGLNKLTGHIPNFNLGVTGTANRFHVKRTLKCSVDVGFKIRRVVQDWAPSIFWQNRFEPNQERTFLCFHGERQSHLSQITKGLPHQSTKRI